MAPRKPKTAVDEVAAEWVDPTTLVPWARNPRINDSAVAAVVASIQRFGFAAPIVARRADRRVIAGHTRLKAALQLGLSRVPVRYLDVSEHDADALTLADNRTGEIAEWDDAEVGRILADLRDAGVPTVGLGWDQEAIDALLAGPVPGRDLTHVPAPGPNIRAKVGADYEAYQVLVTCPGEPEQVAMLSDMDVRGYPAKSLITAVKTTKAKVTPDATPLDLPSDARHVVRTVAIAPSCRVRQLEGLFDVAPAAESREEWTVRLPLAERPWTVGLIVGPSGSGKSTIAREFFGEAIVGDREWSPDRAVIDDFPTDMGIADITGLLSSVGFSSPPAWMRPFRVLSTGQQFRVAVARALADARPVTVVDEFTSVVDRQVAQVGSAAIARAVRQGGRKFVAVSCHSDIVEWLQPDWILDMATSDFQWRSVQRRPSLDLHVEQCHISAWRLFKKHHYLTADIHVGCPFYVAFLGDVPVACLAVWCAPHQSGTARWYISRVVVLPDYQGVGIALPLCTAIAAHYGQLGITASHPALVSALLRSPDWVCTRKAKLTPGHTGLASASTATRSTWSFEYAAAGVVRVPEEAPNAATHAPTG